MALNFADALDTKLDAVEKPPLPPVGSYIFQITKVPVIATLPGDEWDTLDFPMVAVEALDDVDADELENFGAIKNIIQRHRFMFNKNDQAEFDRTMFNVRRFLEEHVKSATPDMSIKEALASCVNQRVVAAIVWKADKRDTETMHANIGRTAPLPE